MFEWEDIQLWMLKKRVIEIPNYRWLIMMMIQVVGVYTIARWFLGNVIG